MTEREILQQQEDNGQTTFVMMLVGGFYHAYGHGAFALARATGYRVMRKRRKAGELLMTGFPASQLPKVLERIALVGGSATPQDGEERLWLLSGLDGTPDSYMIAPDSSKTRNGREESMTPVVFSVVETLRQFPLATASPIDAIVMVGQLQAKLAR